VSNTQITLFSVLYFAANSVFLFADTSANGIRYSQIQAAFSV